MTPRNSASAMPSACSSQPGPLSASAGSSTTAARPNADGHHRLGRVPVREQPLGRERVDRVRAAGHDRERDAGRPRRSPRRRRARAARRRRTRARSRRPSAARAGGGRPATRTGRPASAPSRARRSCRRPRRCRRPPRRTRAGTAATAATAASDGGGRPAAARAAPRRRARRATSSAPPTRMRAAPTPIGSVPDGAERLGGAGGGEAEGGEEDLEAGGGHRRRLFHNSSIGVKVSNFGWVGKLVDRPIGHLVPDAADKVTTRSRARRPIPPPSMPEVRP